MRLFCGAWLEASSGLCRVCGFEAEQGLFFGAARYVLYEYVRFVRCARDVHCVFGGHFQGAFVLRRNNVSTVGDHELVNDCAVEEGVLNGAAPALCNDVDPRTDLSLRRCVKDGGDVVLSCAAA